MNRTLQTSVTNAIVVVTALVLLPSVTLAKKPAPFPRLDVLQAAVELAKDDKADPKAREDAITFLRAALQQEKDQLAETSRMFRFTNIESIVMFSLAHLLALLALVAATSEFFASRKLRRKALASPEHEIEIGIEKLAIKTSSIALLYLLAALTFYFMYVKFVYPVIFVGEGS